jgi:hypothetical protein
MPDLTPRLGIKKPLGNENVTRASFNENYDIIDAKVATVGVDGKVPVSQLPTGVANGLATLGSDGKVPAGQLNVSSSADKITVVDAGDYYVSANAEGALQEVGKTLNAMRGSLITSANNVLGG